MASPKPAVIVRREFEATPEVVTQQLRACIVGPACQLVRYNKSAEKSKGLVETVASITPSTINGGLLYAANAFKTIPNLAYSSVLDATSVKVFIDDAYLTYADLAAASSVAPSNDFRSAGDAQSNALVLNSTGWKATTGFARNGGLVQDVAVGDIVQIYTTSSGSAVLNKTTTVQGFTAAEVVGVIGAGSFSGAAAYSTAIPANVIAGGVTLTLNAAAAFNEEAEQVADPRRAGKRFTTYTVAITSFDGTNLGVSVTSDTGLDSIAGSIAASGVLALPSGVTVTAPASFASVTIGGSSTFAYGPVQVVYAQAGQGTTATNTLTTTSGAPGAGLTKNTTYYVTCISGGALKSTAGCTFRVSTNNGADVVSTINVAGLTTASAIKTIGSYGISLNFNAMAANSFTAGFVKGDVFTIVVTAASAGMVKTLVVADPYTINTAITSVRLSKQVSLEVNQLQADASTTNWVLTSPTDADLRGVTISSAPKMRHSSVNSGLTDCRITAGKVYFQYRSFLAISPEVGSATTLADITAQLGTIDPANDLAYGVYKAWSNANGATVHFIPTQSSDLNGTNGFAAALDLAKGNRNCYSLVPLSTSAEVWNAFVGHANDESAPATGRFRIVWIAPEVDKHNKIQDSPIGDAGTILTANSSAVGGGQTGKYYVTATAGLDSRFGQTARVGDYIRTKFEPTATGGESYVEYRVTAVVDNTTLIILAAVDPSLVSQKIQLFRDLSGSELAAEYVKVSGSFSSERVFAVIPDRGVNGFRVDGVPVKNWYVACAFAGLRAGSRPHQPLSNVELLGFDGSNDTVMAFNETNLDTLRDGGCWVVRNAEDGTVYAERQLSTSTLDIYRKEQSVTCNIDSIAFSVADGLRDLVGRINISPNTLQVVSVNLQAIMDTFLNKTGSASIGAQLLSYTITSVSVPATAKDTVLVRLAVTLPVPMNVIDITIVI